MYQISLNLYDPDERLLLAIVDLTGASRADVLRWALRYYALDGPWTSADPHHRCRVLGGDPGMLVVGPRTKEVG